MLRVGLSLPSFTEDVRSFLVGPAWLLGPSIGRLGLSDACVT
jgi:hypothetical protein